MADYTPGPWKIGAIEHDHAEIRDQENRLIADVWLERATPDDVPCPPREEAEANARLIAAAPELLKGIKNIGNMLRCTIGSPAFWEICKGIGKAEEDEDDGDQ